MIIRLSKKIYCLQVLLLCGILAGCSSKPLIVGMPGEAIAEDEVMVFFARRPSCEFETIAHLTMETPYFSTHSLVMDMRLQAAELGANALYVEQTRRLPGREYVGTGRAIRCINLPQT